MRFAMRWPAPAGLSALLLLASASTRTAGPERAAAANLSVPVSFVENRGQTDARVRFSAQGDRYAVYATRGSVVLALERPGTARGLALALRFPAARPEGAQRLSGTVNYLRGDRRVTGLRRYGAVVYRGLWPGIDLRVEPGAGALKYELRVHPGASPSAIALAYAGARHLSVDAAGRLRLDAALGTLRDSAPVSYQVASGRRVPVASRFALRGAGRFGFAVGAYRHDRDLVIDPGIHWTTFLGGSANEDGAGVAVDAAGNTYVAGTTQSPDFPTVGAFRRTGAAQNSSDVFVTKLNPNGNGLVYSTFVGGSNLDFGRRIAIDAAGNAYVTGQTKSSNFPTTGGAFSRALHIPPNCPRCATDNTDGFAFKLNAAGSALAYSTYLGGTDYDDPRGIAVDGSGNAYVAGDTLSLDYPTTAGAFQRTLRGQYDEFVTKLNPTGSALAYSTFVGGTQVDNGERIAVDSTGSAYVVGFSSSADFPTTAGAFDRTANGAFDVTVTKLSPAGSALVYSTFLGGSGFDTGSGLAVDGAGNAFVSGGAGSTDFPTTPGAFDTSSDGSDAFVTKLSPTGSAAVYSTVVGGTDGDGANGVALDPAGDAWFSGTTGSVSYPVTADAADATFDGGVDGLITELNPAGSALLYSTFLGGSGSDVGTDLGRGPAGDVFVTGTTSSMDFPATVGAFDTVFNGDPLVFWGDAFVTRLSLSRTTSAPVAPQPVPAAPALLAPANGSAADQPITFQWNGVAAAASYEIQIAGSSSFAAPLVRDATVSQTTTYATGGLATATQFWRVRGINLNGVAGAWSAVRSFTPLDAPPPAVLSTMSTQPDTVVGGEQSTVTAVLSVGAPLGGAVVSLASSNPAVAPVPSTVTIPENGFAGTAFFTTTPVSAPTTVTITGTYNGSTRTATLWVTPSASTPPPPPPSAQTAIVTVNASGRSGVTVSSSPAGIAVSSGSSGSASFRVGDSVTLSGSGGRKAVWSGGCSSGGQKTASCTFTVGGDTTVGANVQ
jgi:hypothetical protein